MLSLAHEHVTKFITTISSDHAYIHDSIAFTISGKTTSIAAAGTYVISFITPATKYIHWRPAFIGSSANILEARLSESAVCSGGDSVTPYNRNRAKPRTSGMRAYTAASETTEGAILDYYIAGASGAGINKTGGVAGADEELVLKLDTMYEFRIENIGTVTATIGYYRLFWYEEDGA